MPNTAATFGARTNAAVLTPIEWEVKLHHGLAQLLARCSPDLRQHIDHMLPSLFWLDSDEISFDVGQP